MLRILPGDGEVGSGQLEEVTLAGIIAFGRTARQWRRAPGGFPAPRSCHNNLLQPLSAIERSNCWIERKTETVDGLHTGNAHAGRVDLALVDYLAYADHVDAKQAGIVIEQGRGNRGNDNGRDVGR